MKSHPKKYEINFLKVKRADWYDVSLIDTITGEKHLSVSMNELDKKTGQPAWKNWKDIKPGDTIEGNLWQSTKGGWYLFPSQEDENANGVVVSATGYRGGNKTAQMNAVMDRKEKGIEDSQTRKEHGIKVSSTASMATQSMIAELADCTDRTIMEQVWLRWRKWYWNNWEYQEEHRDPKEQLPF